MKVKNVFLCDGNTCQGEEDNCTHISVHGGMVMRWDKEQLEKLVEHCRGCPHLMISVDGDEEIYECELLADEIISEWEEDDEFYDTDGSEGILAIAHYDNNGDLIDFELMDFFPKSCPRERGGDGSAE